MRRTKVAQIYRKTGNLRAVQLLLGHTKLESTVRYLGIEVDDSQHLRAGRALTDLRGPATRWGRSYPGSYARCCP
jgi:hypothetical protein